MSDGWFSSFSNFFQDKAQGAASSVFESALRLIPFIGDWLADTYSEFMDSEGPGMGNAVVEGRDLTAELQAILQPDGPELSME